jgi:hypothetical protein
MPTRQEREDIYQRITDKSSQVAMVGAVITLGFRAAGYLPAAAVGFVVFWVSIAALTAAASLRMGETCCAKKAPAKRQGAPRYRAS